MANPTGATLNCSRIAEKLSFVHKSRAVVVINPWSKGKRSGVWILRERGFEPLSFDYMY